MQKSIRILFSQLLTISLLTQRASIFKFLIYPRGNSDAFSLRLKSETLSFITDSENAEEDGYYDDVAYYSTQTQVEFSLLRKLCKQDWIYTEILINSILELTDQSISRFRLRIPHLFMDFIKSSQPQIKVPSVQIMIAKVLNVKTNYCSQDQQIETLRLYAKSSKHDITNYSKGKQSSGNNVKICL